MLFIYYSKNIILWNVNRYKMRNSPEPKKVKINLLSPDRTKKTKKSESPPKKQIYKQSIGKLKKTFNDGVNVYEHIKMQHDRKIKQIQNNKAKQKMRYNERILNQQYHEPISQQQLNICTTIFSALDKSNKKYTEILDIHNIEDRTLTDIIKVVYVRKQKSSLFDFVFALWDSDSLTRLKESYKNKI